MKETYTMTKSLKMKKEQREHEAKKEDKAREDKENTKA